MPEQKAQTRIHPESESQRMDIFTFKVFKENKKFRKPNPNWSENASTGWPAGPDSALSTNGRDG